MKIATIRTVCECQAHLEADLDEGHLVLQGRAQDRRGRVEMAPAHSIGAASEQFQVAWSCPFCIRNQLRSFDAGGLSYREVADAEPAAQASPG
jgi:hypothetical protein